MTTASTAAAGAQVPPASDGAFARWLADLAGRALVELRADPGYARDPDALRAAGDKSSHDLITGMLARWRPGDAVLSEEGVRDDPARLSAERVWIVDPLDGTREFGEPGRTDWAVHIGLWARDSAAPGRLAAAAVALPAQHRVFGSDLPPGYPPMSADSAQAATVSGEDAGNLPRSLSERHHGGAHLRIAVSRTRPPAFLEQVAAQLGATLVPMGSAGAKIIAVVTGEVDAYVHAGGQYEWDSAAPVGVATATGLHASRVDGSALEYNQADPLLPDIVVCRKDLASRLLAALRSSR